MYTAEKLIQTALKELGYLEKSSLMALDEKKENAGSGNYTKYARDLYQAGYYNGSKQGVPWCSVFVDWCHWMASEKDAAQAKRISCQSGPYGASCTYAMGYYRQEKRFFAAPEPGDQIFFGTGATAEHTGIVVKVEGDTLYTVEGNTSSARGVVANGGGVFQKSYPLNHSKILGYGRPYYREDSSAETAPPRQETGDFSLQMRILRKTARGEDVRAMQNLLIAQGFSCGSWGADGNFGAATESAVLLYQKKNSLQTDGMAGPETWHHLLGSV